MNMFVSLVQTTQDAVRYQPDMMNLCSRKRLPLPS